MACGVHDQHPIIPMLSEGVSDVSSSDQTGVLELVVLKSEEVRSTADQKGKARAALVRTSARKS
jgi:hypothetical protein